MAQLGSLLDTGDKVGSIVGAAIAAAALWVAVRAGKRRRRRRDPGVTALLSAQRADTARHRYRFFGEHVPALTDLYVRPRVTLGRPAEGESHAVEATKILGAYRHAVLLGDAGAGKSSFLATVAGDLARRALTRPRGQDIAVILPAADLVGWRLSESLARAVRRDHSIDLSAEVFERPPVRGGTWRVLLDGLDEVVDPQCRSEILWRIRNLLADSGPYHRFLITCRPLTEPELAELRGPMVGVYDLRPFDRHELDDFAHRWFTARFPNDRRRASESVSRFLARVAGARLGPVARIPLLATIAARVYESADDRALPSSRAALYERFVEHLLDGCRALERFREAVEPDLLSRGTPGEAVAAWLRSDIHKHVGDLLRECGAAWLTNSDVCLTDVAAMWIRGNAPYDLTRFSPDADRLLRDLLVATGVCTLHQGRVVFTHQSFAEYFAASVCDTAFNESAWLERAIDPATRSFAAFVAARQPDPDALLATLLARGESNAAGDLLADGLQIQPITRDQIVARLLRQVADETERAPEALRILGELSLDADVLQRMARLAASPDASSWTRALLADRIADIDSGMGHELLRTVAEDADEVVRAWVVDALQERGGRVDPNLRVPLAADAVSLVGGPLGTLARLALKQRLADVRATESERLAAARQLAQDGDIAALRAMAEAVGIDALHRVRLASALADYGDRSLLRALAAGSAGTPQAVYAAALDLFGRDDPTAGVALRGVTEVYPDSPMAFAAAARCADLGDRDPLRWLARRPGQVHVRLAAARRLATLGNVEALSWLLEDSLDPAIEADVLASLLQAGRTEAVPRLSRLLRQQRFPSYQATEWHYLLAANGEERSREILYRQARRRMGSAESIAAAVSLTALADPRGATSLKFIASARRKRFRARMRAAAGLARLDPIAGREVLERLTGPDSSADLRLRAATAALDVLGTADLLAGIAFNEDTPAEIRAAAIDRLVGPQRGWGYGEDQRRPCKLSRETLDDLIRLAATEVTPAEVRVSAAPLLPEAAAREVLGSIAAGTEAPGTRVAAIWQLDTIDSQAAHAAFSQLLRDRRIGRLRRWLLVVSNEELLSETDAATIKDRFGDPDKGVVRRLCNALRPAAWEPERVLGPPIEALRS